jgi:6-phospho 3-hexuloisomerase
MISGIILKYLKGLQESLSTVSNKKTEKLIDDLLQAKRIFIFGAGRSGLVGKAFAMRLMHLDKQVHFIGETTTPAIEENDVIFFVSGSGNTLSVVNMLKAAQSNGRKIKILGLSSEEKGCLYQNGDNVILINTPQKETSGDYLTMQILGNERKVAPLGTNFESSALVYLDSLIVLMMVKLGKDEADMKKKHANIE